MGFWKRDPVELETIRLEQELYYAQTEERRDEVKAKLRDMYSLRSEKNKDKMHITGDGLLRCVTMIGLAAIGFAVEQFGGIIPGWAKQKP